MKRWLEIIGEFVACLSLFLIAYVLLLGGLL